MFFPAKITDWMRDHAPHTLAPYVMPYLIVLLTVIAFLSADTAFNAKHLAEENQHIATIAHTTADELQEGLVWGCKYDTNVLRSLLRSRLRNELASPAKIKEYRDLFPTIPPGKLALLVKKSNVEKRDEIYKLRPINCVALYGGRPTR